VEISKAILLKPYTGDHPRTPPSTFYLPPILILVFQENYFLIKILRSFLVPPSTSILQVSSHIPLPAKFWLACTDKEVLLHSALKFVNILSPLIQIFPNLLASEHIDFVFFPHDASPDRL
jgi:hypothetical protein